MVRSILIAALALPVLAQDEEQLRWLVQGAPDPAAISSHDGSGLYVFATGKGIAIWHSPDGADWKKVGRVFDEDVPARAKKLIPGADSVWAPDIQYANGKYYLYYSVSTFGSQRSVIGLATNKTLNSRSPEYQWDDQGIVLESFPDRNDFNAIDSAMYAEGDRAWLVWGSYWTGIKGAEINTRSGRPDSTQPKAVSIAGRAENGSVDIEAPYLVKRDGWYYLFVSWDFCCDREQSTYKIMVGRSKAPLGPYFDRQGRNMSEGGGTLVLMSDGRWRGPGHNSVLRHHGQDYLVYHVVDSQDPDAGRQLQMRSLEWKNGWPSAGSIVTSDLKDKPGPPLSGRWIHVVDERDTYDIFFEPTGRITGVRGKAEWKREGSDLLLQWIDPNAPGGRWIDRVKLSDDLSQYSGRNQNGTLIQGRRALER